ncbi:MAG: GNAT family N-acetyltransferase [Oscillatoriales cyanobacterium RU_3_3]|nr:GNAT family N-acetyltransferase [Oscillatoriales cyanobacterium RU_3_3]NJR23516.1 GNAT family N-acetyltransferase [Richelia sp. CSU_2_1]
MDSIDIIHISDIELVSMNHLVEESLSQGFRFVERLLREYRSGFNCFDKPGEILLAASDRGRSIAIGGLNRDPYFNDPKIGRLRHLYVELAWRRQGIGRLLVDRLIREAAQHYQLLTLRTDTPAADKFYRKLGFKTHPNWEHTTHHLPLGELKYSPPSLN